MIFHTVKYLHRGRDRDGGRAEGRDGGRGRGRGRDRDRGRRRGRGSATCIDKGYNNTVS